MERRVEAATVEGFVQQLAVAYVGRGYYFYVTGFVPEGKDPARVDAKLCARYGVGLSKWARARRRAAGRASHAYIRYRRFFVLLATHGESPFFADESRAIRDARRTPIRFSGYAISHREGHVHVRIDRPIYLGIKAYLVGVAPNRDEADLADEFRRTLDFEPYAPVRSQCRAILRAVNRARAAAGLPEVSRACLRIRRRVIRPFDRPPDPRQE